MFKNVKLQQLKGPIMLQLFILIIKSISKMCTIYFPTKYYLVMRIF